MYLSCMEDHTIVIYRYGVDFYVKKRKKMQNYILISRKSFYNDKHLYFFSSEYSSSNSDNVFGLLPYISS